MKIKICGLKDPGNIAQVTKLLPDYMGFIFYDKSPRYVGKLDPLYLKKIPPPIDKIGVFVNQSIEEVYGKVIAYELDFVQLHGYESAEYCKQLRAKGIRVIKAFGMDDLFDFKVLSQYTAHCDYFVFDTATAAFGGSGRSFNWQLLEQYQLDTAFLLGGGLGVAELNKIAIVKHPMFFGVDLNSKIESTAGIKNINKTKLCIEIIKKI